jgi:predicted nuclease of restriction endonuclease-like (RecB) superfamily
MKKKPQEKAISQTTFGKYGGLVGGIAELLEAARRTAARTVNALMTATYWEIGRRIVEFEQEGEERAGYGEQLLAQLSADLTSKFGRGFGVDNLQRFRSFFLNYPLESIYATLSRRLPEARSDISQTSPGTASILSTVSIELAGRKSPTPSSKSQPKNYATASRNFKGREAAQRALQRTGYGLTISELTAVFPLSWSHYVRLLSVKNESAHEFYHAEALRGGWSVRQLDRQINSLFYERTALSRDKAKMLTKGVTAKPQDAIAPEEEIKDPYVLEFLGLKDEYSESDLEEALLRHLEIFLLELGGDFAFIGRQRRLRIGGDWYRVDLLFFHRKLRCLVVIDLKVGKFTHADAGQMHLYLNYAREHWTQPDENPPVGLILCAEKDDAIAKYALEGLPNKVLAREYKLTLPNEKLLAAEIEKTRELLERGTRK